MTLRFIITIFSMLSAVAILPAAAIFIVGSLGYIGTPGNQGSGAPVIITIIAYLTPILSLFVFFNGIMVLINWNNKPNALAYSKYGIYPATVVIAISLLIITHLILKTR